MQFLKKNPDDEQFATEIIPAIIARDFEEVRNKVSRVELLVHMVQLDIMDGVFVPAYTWPYESHEGALDDGSGGGDIDDLDKLDTKLALELHLMIVNPEELLNEWLIHGEVKRVLLHVESTLKLGEAIDIAREAKREVGLVLRLETPLESVTPYIDRVSHVQLMAIEDVGFGGKPFSSAVLPRIKKLRAMFPHCTIAVDGGISRMTASEVIKAGADVLVVGSALFGATDIGAEIEVLKNRK